MPVYFAYENDQLAELVETLDRDTSGAAGQKVSAAESEFFLNRHNSMDGGRICATEGCQVISGP